MMSQFPSLEIVCFTSHPGQPYSTCEKKKNKQKYSLDYIFNMTFISIAFLFAVRPPVCSAPEKEGQEERRLE